MVSIQLNPAPRMRRLDNREKSFRSPHSRCLPLSSFAHTTYPLRVPYVPCSRTWATCEHRFSSPARSHRESILENRVIENIYYSHWLYRAECINRVPYRRDRFSRPSRGTINQSRGYEPARECYEVITLPSIREAWRARRATARLAKTRKK